MAGVIRVAVVDDHPATAEGSRVERRVVVRAEKDDRWSGVPVRPGHLEQLETSDAAGELDVAEDHIGAGGPHERLGASDIRRRAHDRDVRLGGQPRGLDQRVGPTLLWMARRNGELPLGR